MSDTCAEECCSRIETCTGPADARVRARDIMSTTLLQGQQPWDGSEWQWQRPAVGAEVWRCVDDVVGERVEGQAHA